jgi:hypothetical protein
MPSHFDDIINLVILAGTALLGVRLLTSGLHRRYRAFFWYLVFYTLQTGILMSLNIRSDLYQKIYILTEPISWIFFALVVLELFSLVLADYHGLYTIGRWALVVAVTLAVIASVLMIMLVPSTVRQSHLMSYYLVTERAVYLSLLVFLFTILCLLLQYPLTLSRNVVTHCLVYTFYFLGNAIFFLLLSVKGRQMVVHVRYAILVSSVGALGAWLALLSPKGEERKVTVRPAWMPGREEELVNQLSSLNAALLRAARK